MVYKWQRDQIENLITAVQENTCIYNIKSKEYIDRTKKAQAFNNVYEALKKIDSSITLDEIKRKWKNLRIQYTQELRAINNSKKSGAATEDIYVPKLWCFDQLNFLKTHSGMRAGKDNINTFIDDDELLTPSDTQNYGSNEEPPKKIQKRIRAVSEFRNDLDNFKTILSQRKKEKPYAWLGTLVVSEMEKISSEDQPNAAWQVQCLMHKLTSQSVRKRNSSSTSSSSKDILELSIERLFDNDDFN